MNTQWSEYQVAIPAAGRGTERPSQAVRPGAEPDIATKVRRPQPGSSAVSNPARGQDGLEPGGGRPNLRDTRLPRRR